MTGGEPATPYGVRLLEVLLRAGRTVHLTLSNAAVDGSALAGAGAAVSVRSASTCATLLGDARRLLPRRAQVQ